MSNAISMNDKNTVLYWKNLFSSEDFAKRYTYTGELGALYQTDATTFRVWAPTARAVSVQLYTTGSDAEENAKQLEAYAMTQGKQGVWSVTVEGDLHGVYYTYFVDVNGLTQETGDVYAKACGVNGSRSMVVDLARTNPAGWEQDHTVVHPLGETEIWEVHIGDFSHDPHSGVKPEHRGKYLAFTEENTTLDGDGVHPTCVNYLKQQGVTHVHLLPAYDYGSVNEADPNSGFNWGYDPENYNVPEGSYSTNPFDGAVRIREFKEMVAALHRAGLSVVMDVVYNHTYSIDCCFHRTVPYYYHRIGDNGIFSNGSACGNDTASERAMFRKYVVDSVCYWATEYHIDGFRFDLMGLLDTDTMNAVRAALNELPGGTNKIVYGEPWSAGETAFEHGAVGALKDNLPKLADGIAVFNDDFRDTIKGHFMYAQNGGFVNGGDYYEQTLRRVMSGLFGDWFAGQPSKPAQVVQYVSAHDNHTLWDKLCVSTGRDGAFEVHDKQLVRLNKITAAMVQLARGIPFMQAAEESARTKLGEDNSYNSSKELNQIDWTRLYEYEDLVLYYRGLMQVRKSFVGFTDLSAENAANMQFIEELPKQVVGYTLETDAAEGWKRVTVLFNASEEDVELTLADGEWTVLVNENSACADGLGTASGLIAVPAYSAAVFAQK
jgi:pullulanase